MDEENLILSNLLILFVDWIMSGYKSVTIFYQNGNPSSGKQSFHIFILMKFPENSVHIIGSLCF